jgi:O-antigen ligase
MRRWLAHLLSFAYLAGAMLLTALSGSRGGILSFSLVLVLMAFARSTRRWTLMAACLVIGAAVATPFLFATAIQRFQESEAGELGGRDVLWYSGILLLRDYPLGAGLGNGKPTMPRYLYARVSSEEFGVWTYRSTHNPVLDVGIDSGIPGMVLYAGAIGAALMSFAGGARQDRAGCGPLPRAFYAVTFFPFAGFFLSWIRDGGMNTHPALFIVLAVLVLPARLYALSLKGNRSHPLLDRVANTVHRLPQNANQGLPERGETRNALQSANV